MRVLKKKYAFILIILALTVSTFIIYESRMAAASEKQKTAVTPQAMPVETHTVERQDIQVWKNFSGNVVAVDRAEIRPQVSGRVTELRFQDGQSGFKTDKM